ncbi:hypothetical protein Glove_309g56 [Diversispora epigaea]|uniref:RNase H type-1 domain-containing protein n=1 Tax=Diversispora epigaea TaxID=1348612 RepID=A0A397HZV6_9GLOM|nr:hypothetical protein Glove_309g56 [Diversispora epigaea]
MFSKFQNFWTQENIQTKLDNIHLKLSNKFNFSGKVENFVLSTRAELMAILTTVYATPKRSRLCIYTDSQAAIDVIANASANPRKAHRKLKNWTFVKAIKEIANVQDLTLRLEKVKTHSGVVHNKTAD